MSIDAILDEIRSLACSQGFYGLLYRSLMEIRDNEPDGWISVVEELEAQHFTDAVDMGSVKNYAQIYLQALVNEVSRQ